jgi:hypothetical protein
LAQIGRSFRKGKQVRLGRKFPHHAVFDEHMRIRREVPGGMTSRAEDDNRRPRVPSKPPNLPDAHPIRTA